MREGFHQNEGEDIKQKIEAPENRFQEEKLRGGDRACGGWIPRVTSEILHQVTEVKGMARRCKGDGGMRTRKETKPGQTGTTQTSRQIPLRTGDKTGTI